MAVAKRVLLVILGNLWMAPNMIVGLILLGFLAMIGSVRLAGTTKWSFRAVAIPDHWLQQKMDAGNWKGFAVGSVIFLHNDWAHYSKGIIHENRHVLQQMVFGVFQPILYILSSIFIWCFIWNKHSYYDNPFERDARRAAGQIVNIPKSQWSGDRWSWW